MIQLQPLSKRPLSSQLYDHTGDHYNDIYFDKVNDTLTHKSTGKRFKMPSLESENLFKAQKSWVDKVKETYLKNRYIDKKEPFISYHNSEQWKEGLKALENGGVVEMCEDAFWHFCECVPPKIYERNSFVCGEAHHHNNNGKAVYLCAIEKDGKYYAQHGTIEQYRNRELFKLN